MKKKLTVIISILLILGAVATSCPAEEAAPEVGKPAPDFQLSTLDGQSIALSGLKGTPVLVNFWATWCGPCTYEMPHLQQFYDERQGDEVVLLAINIQEGSSKVAQFMQSQGFSFTVLLDSQAAVAQRYNVQGIPTTFFIDSDGVIQEIKIGSFRSKTEIENILSQLD
jgi:peroxiredoxin